MDLTLAMCSTGCRWFCHPVSHSRPIGQTGVCGTWLKSVTQAWSNFLTTRRKMYLHDLEPRCKAAKFASHKPQRPGWSWNGTRWWFGQGRRVKTSPVMESRAEPSRGSCGSIIATLCDVAMAARAVPAWFPDVWEQAEAAGERRAALRVWGAQACAGKPRWWEDPCVGDWRLSAQSFPRLFPPSRSENRLWFLQDFKTPFFFTSFSPLQSSPFCLKPGSC